MLVLSLFGGFARAEDDIAAQEEAAFKAAAAEIAPSVLRVETFGGNEKVGDVLVGSGPTTGLVVGAEGYVLSSTFNFAQKPSSIVVTLPSGKRVAATIVARDHSRMLVLLKVESEQKLAVPKFATRDQIEVGQWALAMGRTFDQPAPNVSVGIISAKNRIWGKAIQTDAKISPANYGGPLIDLEGRVLGLLTPLSPQEQGDVAGAEWYDSGIGFATPLAEWLPRLEMLKSGKDLHQGLLGVALKQGDTNSTPAIIVAAQPGGPADKAGLKPQDKIVAIDGKMCERQTEFKHLLGPRYAGDRLRVTVERGKERIEKEIELVDQLQPYEHPLLGILPLRGSPERGVTVRHVFADSPAAAIGLVPGDRITKWNDRDLADAAALREALAAHAPRDKGRVTWARGGETIAKEVTLAKLSVKVPAKLPPDRGNLPKVEQPATGVTDVQLPEEKNACAVYVPATYHKAVPHGLLIALHTPGKYDRDALVARYQPMCDQHHLLLLLPRAVDVARWEASDRAFIKKAAEDVARRYTIDRERVAIAGYQAAGAMAWSTSLEHPDLIRAAIVVEAPLPPRAQVPPGEPNRRWWFVLAGSSKSPQREAIAASAKRIGEQRHELVKIDTGDAPRELSARELDDLGRWLDTLDRL